MLKIVMLNPEDPREALEVARIQEDDQFLSVLAVIRRGYNTARENSITFDGPNLYRVQGAAQALKQLLQCFTDAKDIVDAPLQENPGKKIFI